MADIELVIKIPEEEYNLIKTQVAFGITNPLKMRIANGTPLPKGHGRLKDIDKIINDGINKGFCEWYDEMKYAPTIIEADEAESEDAE